MFAVETPAAGVLSRPKHPGSPFRSAGQNLVPAPPHYPFPPLNEARAAPLQRLGPRGGEALADMLADELAAAFTPAPETDEEGDVPFDVAAPLFGRDDDGPAHLAEAPPADSPESRRAVALMAAVAGLAGLVGAGSVFGMNALLTRVGPQPVAIASAAPAVLPPAAEQPAPPVARKATVVAAAVAAPPAATPFRAQAVIKPVAVAAPPLDTVEKVADERVEETITAAIPPVVMPHAPPEVMAAAQRTITVMPGDSLSDIAKRAYGDHRAFKRIFEANRDVLRRPEQLKVGMTLRIP